MKVRSRFAPSPTGFMHIGNLRTAIYEYLLAKKNNGDFILRIEDTDQERKVEGAVEFIYDVLKLCGFIIDEGPMNEGAFGPYVQSERKSLYKEYAMKLVETDKAYMCFCTEEELDTMRNNAEKKGVPFLYNGPCKHYSKEEVEGKLAAGDSYVIRQKMPRDGITVVEDVVYGEIKIENKILEDQILLKSDGFPTYNFANVVDDHLMEISHVVRGKEYLDQTAKYNLLYEAFGWKKPTYIHVAMVLGEDGAKLSKRNGDASFMDLYDIGYLPKAIVNYLVFLGWSPASNQEIFSVEDLVACFDEKRISKSSSQYDAKKMQWYNQQYIKAMDVDKYLAFVKPFLEDGYDLSNKSEEWINHLLSIYKDHISYGKEIVEVTDLFFRDDVILNQECSEFMTSDESIPGTIDCFKSEIEAMSDWNVENINAAINNVKEKSGAKGKLLYMPIRIKVSGQMHGPELPDTIYLLGKDVVLKRLG